MWLVNNSSGMQRQYVCNLASAFSHYSPFTLIQRAVGLNSSLQRQLTAVSRS